MTLVRFSEVVPGLVQGGCPAIPWPTAAGASAGLDEVEVIGRLRDDFDVIVSLEEHVDRCHRHFKGLFVHWPIKDAAVPDESTLRALAGLLADLRLSRKRVFVHCSAGLNRSGLLVALTLIELGYGADEAIAAVRAGRSSDALCNPTFETWLRTEA